jgi:hypothetical protein
MITARPRPPTGQHYLTFPGQEECIFLQHCQVLPVTGGTEENVPDRIAGGESTGKISVRWVKWLMEAMEREPFAENILARCQVPAPSAVELETAI